MPVHIFDFVDTLDNFFKPFSLPAGATSARLNIIIHGHSVPFCAVCVKLICTQRVLYGSLFLL